MKPLLLCILDGVGIRKETYGNALKSAKTPNLDYLFNRYPNCLLSASEEDVGLPKGQMGNSEVGHINIGTGRKVRQPLDIINDSINDGSLKDNKVLLDLIKHVKNNSSTLHICGLLSDGGIHSHIDHLFGLIDILKNQDIDVSYHIFTDGRDTKPNKSIKYIDLLEEKINETKLGKISTVCGRYYSMDRDNRWDRIKLAYDEMTLDRKVYDIKEKIIDSYDNNITDEFIVPFSTCNKKVKDNDGMLVFNFRPDRLRELFSAFTNPEFKEFQRKKINNLKLVTMMPVDKSVICENLFKHTKVDNYLGKIIEMHNLKQLRIAETEKYAHVTYFFDGENKTRLKNCDEILIPSKKVATYDMYPEMSSYEITEKLLEIMDNYDIIILNFAGGDMVGHTGNFAATVKAIEAIDKCIGKIYDKVRKIGGTMIITADHGNCDTMIENGDIITSHSLEKVPFIITKDNLKLKDGKLSDIAPTILKMLNLGVPKEMTGEDLVEE
ncbi:MAG: 2,3-bisphosphoglycerate-independent phosphoglycerate mutase [Bacilli bacterium]|nr:2,3-bisphosphoglycerate-independent phosphoglycerate mutase [Bacilli bacterium]